MTSDSRIAIVGLGYVGLPLAISFVEAGLTVEGIDAHLPRVAELASASRRSTTSRTSASRRRSGGGLTVVGPADAHLDRGGRHLRLRPDADHGREGPGPRAGLAAAALIREHLRSGQLVVLQSTTFPGTTTGPFREELERSGLVAGRDFDLAFAPERVNPGDPASASKAIPRLVGATTPAATERAAALLRRINDHVSSCSRRPTPPSCAKLLENVFRNVNIALVNQLALLCERMGIDVWEVIDAAATKPFGFMRFTPGPGRRRALHPGRSVLPLLAGPRVRFRRPVRRAGRRHQPRDATPRRRPRRRGPERSGHGAPRGAGRRSSGSRSSRTSGTPGTRRRRT